MSSVKKTIDGISQFPRTWYYLLDFNDADDFKTIESLTGKRGLHQLTNEQYQLLFQTAMMKDMNKDLRTLDNKRAKVLKEDIMSALITESHKVDNSYIMDIRQIEEIAKHVLKLILKHRITFRAHKLLQEYA